MGTINQFDESNFIFYCNHLANKDAGLKKVIDTYSYPPIWKRKQSFETLVHIILEQQVSLASAKAALDKLKEKIKTIAPQKILLLTDAELKTCYFSRQKIVYARHLAAAILSKQLNLKKLAAAPDEKVREALKKIKGIGNWTADVFLMMCLHRCDCFPTGDIALIKSIKETKDLPAHTSIEEILQLVEKWKPYRTVAAFLLWHAYIKKRNLKY